LLAARITARTGIERCKRVRQEESTRPGNHLPMNPQPSRRDTADPVAYYTANPGAVAAIAEREAIDLVALFGSAARGRLRTESDLDVAVHFRNGRPDFETEARVAAELHAALKPPRELDLVLLHHASPLLLIQVAVEGIVLYQATTEVWPLFQLYARRRFEDTEKYRQRRWETHLERSLL
jgi:predicted nucleotidyltransferase